MHFYLNCMEFHKKNKNKNNKQAALLAVSTTVGTTYLEANFFWKLLNLGFFSLFLCRFISPAGEVQEMGGSSWMGRRVRLSLSPLLKAEDKRDAPVPPSSLAHTRTLPICNILSLTHSRLGRAVSRLCQAGMDARRYPRCQAPAAPLQASRSQPCEPAPEPLRDLTH